MRERTILERNRRALIRHRRETEASARETDRQDIVNQNVINAIDWDLLERLALSEDEAKSSALNDRSYRDFIADYEEYVRRYRQ